MRRERELELRPFIAFATEEPGALGIDAPAVTVTFGNIGRGPAFTCQFWGCRGKQVRANQPTGATDQIPEPALATMMLLPELHYFRTAVYAIGAGEGPHPQSAEFIPSQPNPSVFRGLMPGKTSREILRSTWLSAETSSATSIDSGSVSRSWTTSWIEEQSRMSGCPVSRCHPPPTLRLASTVIPATGIFQRSGPSLRRELSVCHQAAQVRQGNRVRAQALAGGSGGRDRQWLPHPGGAGAGRPLCGPESGRSPAALWPSPLAAGRGSRGLLSHQ